MTANTSKRSRVSDVGSITLNQTLEESIESNDSQPSRTSPPQPSPPLPLQTMDPPQVNGSFEAGERHQQQILSQRNSNAAIGVPVHAQAIPENPSAGIGTTQTLPSFGAGEHESTAQSAFETLQATMIGISETILQSCRTAQSQPAQVQPARTQHAQIALATKIDNISIYVSGPISSKILPDYLTHSLCVSESRNAPAAQRSSGAYFELDMDKFFTDNVTFKAVFGFLIAILQSSGEHHLLVYDQIDKSGAYATITAIRMYFKRELFQAAANAITRRNNGLFLSQAQQHSLQQLEGSLTQMWAKQNRLDSLNSQYDMAIQQQNFIQPVVNSYTAYPAQSQQAYIQSSQKWAPPPGMHATFEFTFPQQPPLRVQNLYQQNLQPVAHNQVRNSQQTAFGHTLSYPHPAECLSQHPVYPSHQQIPRSMAHLQAMMPRLQQQMLPAIFLQDQPPAVHPQITNSRLPPHPLRSIPQQLSISRDLAANQQVVGHAPENSPITDPRLQLHSVQSVQQTTISQHLSPQLLQPVISQPQQAASHPPGHANITDPRLQLHSVQSVQQIRIFQNLNTVPPQQVIPQPQHPELVEQAPKIQDQGQNGKRKDGPEGTMENLAKKAKTTTDDEKKAGQDTSKGSMTEESPANGSQVNKDDSLPAAEKQAPEPQKRRGPGRPPGAKNRSREEVLAAKQEKQRRKEEKGKGKEPNKPENSLELTIPREIGQQAQPPVPNAVQRPVAPIQPNQPNPMRRRMYGNGPPPLQQAPPPGQIKTPGYHLTVDQNNLDHAVTNFTNNTPANELLGKGISATMIQGGRGMMTQHNQYGLNTNLQEGTQYVYTLDGPLARGTIAGLETDGQDPYNPLMRAAHAERMAYFKQNGIEQEARRLREQPPPKFEAPIIPKSQEFQADTGIDTKDPISGEGSQFLDMFGSSVTSAVLDTSPPLVRDPVLPIALEDSDQASGSSQPAVSTQQPSAPKVILPIISDRIFLLSRTPSPPPETETRGPQLEGSVTPPRTCSTTLDHIDEWIWEDNDTEDIVQRGPTWW